ncbi:MAG: transporter [Thermoanaerobaculia bacterium]
MSRGVVVSLGVAGPLLALALSLPLQADDISPDRPDFTNGPETVGAGVVQVEGGATYAEGGGEHGETFGELLLRVGVGSRFELRLAPGSYDRSTDRDGRVTTGFEDSAFGAKLQLAEEKGRRPALGLIVMSTVPSGARALRESAWQPGLAMALGWTLSPSFDLSANLGAEWDREEGRRFTSGFASVSLGWSAGEKLGLYGEVYGFSREHPGGQEASYADAGITWLVNPDLQLDLRAGTRLTHGDNRFTTGAGVSYRF